MFSLYLIGFYLFYPEHSSQKKAPEFWIVDNYKFHNSSLLTAVSYSERQNDDRSAWNKQYKTTLSERRYY